ncbi:probable sarcosine oxidase [Typha angustifolia]|uniref:probable sarcosine oxidase n=1 Tax=Typha angustifolia TaxID=59011 RepID=UPI003C2F270A
MELPGDRFDVIIIGGGIMGSCTAYEAAKRGRRALLLEQFDFLHHRGSSHGESRTIRATYPKSYYPPLVLESYSLWSKAESEAGYRVLTKTRHLVVGPAADCSLQAVIANSAARVIDRTEVDDLFSGSFRLPDGWIGISEAGGVIKPTKAVAMFQTLALKRGAVLKDHTEVKEIKKDEAGGVLITTANGHMFRGAKCVVTVGSWTRKLVNTVTGLVLPIQPLHTCVCYWKIKDGYEKDLTLEKGFPTFSSYSEPHIYGTPSAEFPGLIKIAMDSGYPCDPDLRDWTSSSGVLVDAVRSWIKEFLPGRVEAERPVMTQACMYSMTPDGDFVIDFLGGEFGTDVVVGAGFSGHGFKMGPAVGRILADLAIDGEAKGVDLRWFRMARFEEDPKGNAKGV